MTLLMGIDTGGTFTDLVVLDAATEEVVAVAKAPTTHHDLVLGVGAALGAVLVSIDPATIGSVALSTTLATNALVEGQGHPACLVALGFDEPELARMGSLPGGAGSGRAGSGEAASDPVVRVAGGHDALGDELTPLDLDALEAAISTIDRGLDGGTGSGVASGTGSVTAYAVAGQFSVRNPAHEEAARDLITRITGKPVTCSHELSARLGGPRRAVTALLNARLLGLIGRLETSVRSSLAEVGIGAPLLVVGGDGSLADAAFAARRPIETILSGPAASVIGAAHLAGVTEGVLADIGGTTTDLATITGGEPGLAPDGAVVAGHRTMVEAIEVTTHGLGGDSEVAVEAGVVSVGPRRAVPLSVAAIGHPDLVTTLEAQLRDRPRTDHARLLVALHPDGADDREREVLALLDAGPRLEREVAVAGRDRAALARLMARGSVRLVAFTPTDAAVVLGRVDPGALGPPGHRPPDDAVARAARTAELGATLLGRQPQLGGEPVAASGAAFATLVEGRVVAASTDQVLGVALAADGLAGSGPGDRSAVVDSPLARAALRRHQGFTAPTVALTGPLIAVGASAHLYYPAVAERLGTAATIPPQAAVANAVGAALGRIRIRRQLTVTRPRSGQYRLHVEGQPLFPSLDAARAEGERILAARVAGLAVEAGAPEPEVDLDWAVRSALVGGREILAEATVTAIATGRPALGGSQISPSRSASSGQ